MVSRKVSRQSASAAVVAALAVAFAEVNRFTPDCSIVTVLADEEAGGLLWLFDARDGFPTAIDTDVLNGLLDAVYEDGCTLPVTFSRTGQILPDIANMTYMIEVAGRAAA